MSRRTFSRKDRARIFEAHGGKCHLCKGKIGVAEAWEVEHLIEWSLTRDDSDDNLAPAHKKCHREKTSARAAELAHVERMKAKHEGRWPKSNAPLRSRGFQSTRNIQEARDAD